MSLDRIFLGRLLSSRACLRFTGQSEHALLVQNRRELSIERQLSEFLFVSITGSVQSIPFDTSRQNSTSRVDFASSACVGRESGPFQLLSLGSY